MRPNPVNPVNGAFFFWIVCLFVMFIVGEKWDRVFNRKWLLLRYRFSSDRSVVIKDVAQYSFPVGSDFIGLKLEEGTFFHLILKKEDARGNSIIWHIDTAEFSWLKGKGARPDEDGQVQFTDGESLNLSTVPFSNERKSRRGRYYLNDNRDEIQILYCRNNDMIHVAIPFNLIHKNPGRRNGTSEKDDTSGKGDPSRWRLTLVQEYSIRCKGDDYHGEVFWISDFNRYFKKIEKLIENGNRTTASRPISRKNKD